ncbi:hypothetical protein PV797_11255 [Clostridiaceae bacterium M8S5]|nr:hypothetical protein PV797_11255 [Clostridiaceae bacterium M8S5]
MREFKTLLKKQYIESKYMKKYTIILMIIIALITSIIIPIVLNKSALRIQLSIVATFTIILLKQWAAESFASEKENKTLESLLSTCVNIKCLFFAKAFFVYLLSSFIQYSLIIILTLINYYFETQVFLELNEIIIFIILLSCIKLFITTRVTLISLFSKNVQVANSMAAKYLYVSILCISIIITLKFVSLSNLIYLYSIFIVFLIIVNVLSIIHVNNKIKKFFIEGNLAKD